MVPNLFGDLILPGDLCSHQETGVSWEQFNGSVFNAVDCHHKGRSHMTERAELLQRISIDPRICFGRPVIRGTRIWVSLIIENLAEGLSQSELLAAYPQLAPEDIRAALAFAAEMTRERIIPIPMESVAG